jgi:glycosyltransferase involved in cell wall biosynthesis
MIKYVLITPARNEEAFVEKTILSVVAQTILPVRWIMIDDGSTDRTGEIADQYARRHQWIEVVHRPRRVERNFAAKAQAVNAALESVKSLQFEVVGNLDADVSFGPDYMAFLLQKFVADPRLGAATLATSDDFFAEMSRMLNPCSWSLAAGRWQD